jgi:hypothetical protein
VFYPDVAKVDLDVVYICMLQAYISSVFECSIHMFASVSAYVRNGFQMFFRRFRKCFRRLFLSVSFVFFYMLQLLHLDVSK